MAPSFVQRRQKIPRTMTGEEAGGCESEGERHNLGDKPGWIDPGDTGADHGNEDHHPSDEEFPAIAGVRTKNLSINVVCHR